MKKLMIGIMIAILVVSFAGCRQVSPKKEIAGEGLAGKLVITVGTPTTKLDKKAKVIINGEGFKAGQEIRLLFTSADSVQSDIGYALKPEPVADNTGKWSTTWSCGRFVAKKLIKEGEYTIIATDDDYNKLAHTTVVFIK